MNYSNAMGQYNFDELIDRRGSGCIKYDGLRQEKGRDDLLPLWVADMDFKTPDFIVDALRERIEHPVFGYPATPSDYFETISSWIKDIHRWDVDPSFFTFIPGIVKGIGFVLDCFCSPGDKVIIQPPVYHPFRIVPQKHSLQVVNNPLSPVFPEGDGGPLSGYTMDLDHLEKILDEKTKVLILSNPHNPAGQCWDKETLGNLAEITSSKGVIVVSDEIHCEMVLGGRQHIPYASVCPQAAKNSITFMSPSKTFNIAGIVSSYAIVPDAELREKYFNFLDADELNYPPIFSVVATEAAYKNGKQWRMEMLEYVNANIDYIDEFLRKNIPSVKCVRPQASFLVWLDCRGLGLTQEKLVSLFEDKAHLELNDGSMFGPQGTGFMRMNVGCPRSVLEEAMRRLLAAV